MRASLNRAHANTSSVLGVIETTRVRITGNRAMEPKRREGFNRGRHFSGIVGVDSGTCKCQVSFCRDDWTKHNIYSSKRRSCDNTPSCLCCTISKASTPVSVDGPFLKFIASFACGFGRRNFILGTAGMCFVRLLGVREHRHE